MASTLRVPRPPSSESIRGRSTVRQTALGAFARQDIETNSIQGEKTVSSLDRPLDGPLVHRLAKDEQTIDRALVEKHGRSARTLVKEGPLRLTLIALAPGGEMPAHKADGPISVQVLQGDATFRTMNETHALEAGDVIVVAASVEHSVSSRRGCSFLLTVVHAQT